MLNVRWTMILREMWSYRGRTVLVVLAVAVGVMVFGIMATARVVLQANIARSYRASNPAHGILFVNDFDETLVNEVSRTPGIAVAEGRRSVTVKVEVSTEAWSTLELQAIPDYDRLAIGRLTYEAGALVPPAPGAVLLERSTRYLLDVEAGDTVRVRLPSGDMRQLEVAGLADDVSLMPSSIVPVGYGFIAFDTLAQLEEPSRYNRLYAIVDGVPDERTAVEHAFGQVVNVVEEAGYTVFSVRVPEPGQTPLESSANTALLLLGTLGSLTLVLSAFLIVNIMAAIVTRQTRQIGIIKSIGGKSTQVTAIYLRMVLLFGVLAALIAVPAAYVGAYFLTDFSATQMDVDIVEYWLPGQVLLWQVLSALVVPVLAALAPILKGATITIREAISDHGAASTTGGAVARLRTPTIVAAMSTRAMFWHKGRVGLTLAALSLGGAMFMAVLNVRGSLYGAVREIQGEWSYDVEIDLLRPAPIADLEEELEAVEGVESVEGWWLVDARRVFDRQWQGGSFTLIGLPPETAMVRPSVREGRWMRPDDERVLFVNADAFNLAAPMTVGEEVELAVAGSAERWTLIGVSSRLWVPWGYTPYRQLAELLPGPHGSGNRFVVRGARSDAAYQAALEMRLLETLSRLDVAVARSATTTQNRLAAEAQIANLVMLLIVMAGLIVLVGGLGLASSMGLNVMERTREIGVLRSIGATSGVIGRMVLLEGVLLGLVSWVLAIVLSLPLTILLNEAMGMELFLRPMEFVFEPVGVVLWGGLVVVLSVLASLLPARNASRLSIRDTLSYEG